MRDAARAAFPAFLERWEGRVPWMYLDTKGLVTCGVGNLIDDGTPGPACGLPWMYPGGARAMLDDVIAAWHRVKAAQSMAPLGGGHFAGLTTMRLLPADIDALVLRTAERFETDLKAGFPQWETFPAAAQVAIFDMAWNMGAGRLIPGPLFEFRHFYAAASAQDWPGAAAECSIQGAPQARNDAHAALFRAAMGDPDSVPTA